MRPGRTLFLPRVVSLAERHALTTLCAIAICWGGGCARARSALPPSPTEVQEPAVELTPLEPIKASINQGKIPADLGTVRASYVVEPEPAHENAPAVSESDDLPKPPPPSAPAAANRPDTPSTPGADAIPLRTSPGLDPGPRAALTAARVGDTVITYRELEFAICFRLKCKLRELQDIKRESPEQANMMARDTLETLIDRTLILQEERRRRKPQQWTTFADYVDKIWREKELTAMCRKAGVEDEFSLRKKMESQGESLDDHHEAYKTETMARELLMIQIQPKVGKPGKRDMEKYYHEHRKQPEYHRDAQVKWQEILIPIAKPSDLASAQKTAAIVRNRLLSGEDFAKVAKATSSGATADRGGTWETSPGGYPVPAVNAALATLPPGQISAPIEGPKGIHLVRVESRRPAGPVPFSDTKIQKQIAETLFQERFSAQIDSYLKELRSRSSITSPLFEGTSTAPAVVQEKAKTDGEAKRTAVK
ncbi:MAG: parvulin-like peptidyl-prolyl isomerase [Planctomycetota bacterium]|nr:parvulin-like peptidyl-prolyl isomerase [Planctomycetota bacterium]